MFLNKEEIRDRHDFLLTSFMFCPLFTNVFFSFTDGGPGPSASFSPKKREAKGQIPGFSLFRKNIHWFSGEEENKDKRQKKATQRNEKQRKHRHKRKDKNRENNDNPKTAIVPYGMAQSRVARGNIGLLNDNPSHNDEGWDTVSINSVTL